MYSNKVEICGVNTAKLPVLKEQEKALRLFPYGKSGLKSTSPTGALRAAVSLPVWEEWIEMSGRYWTGAPNSSVSSRMGRVD